MALVSFKLSPPTWRLSHVDGRARPQKVAADEEWVADAERDQELIERVPHVGLEQHVDGDEVSGEAENGDDRGEDPVHPVLEIQYVLETRGSFHMNV